MSESIEASGVTPNEDDTLVLVHALFRHGDRTPDVASLAPKDPHLKESFAPYGHGELTNKGRRTQYELGKFLRKRYGKFLGDMYYPDLLYARTTELNRTKMSLELVLAGLFPPVGDQVWMEGMNWQPIPIHYENSLHDEVLLGLTCPNFKQYYDEHANSKGVLAECEDYKKYFDYISENSGVKVTSFREIYVMFFGLLTEEEWGLKLPQWTKKIYRQPMESLALHYYNILVGTTKLKQLVSGYFIKKVVEDTNAKINGTLAPQARKIFLYSAHEFNLACLLITLGVYKPKVPPYGGCILFEVHKIDGVYGLKLFYYDYSESEPLKLTLPDCEEFCPIDKFVSFVGDFMPPDGLCGH